MGKIEDFLAHYASEYYDPAKAREYYLRTRELKGRSAALKTDNQKAGWAYAKNQIDTEKKATLEAIAAENQAALETLRSTATDTRKSISEKLKTLLGLLTNATENERTRISKDRQANLERIAEETKTKIAAVPEVPKGLSKERTAELRTERRLEIAKIRGDAKVERQQVAENSAAESAAISDSVADVKTSVKDAASKEREQVATDLKDSVDKARGKYALLKEEVKAKYEAKYQQEYDAIKNNV